MEEYHIFGDDRCRIVYFPRFKQAISFDYMQFDNQNMEMIIEDAVTKMESTASEEKEGTDNIWGLYLCVSNMCNASCVYCFANQGDYGKEKGLMSFDIAKKAIDFFLEKVPNDKEAAFIFFGGEPLMAFDVIEQSCKYINDNHSHRLTSFHITTNGTLLDKDKINFLVQNQFRVVISIDGGDEIQNIQRPLRNGKNSFEAATKNIGYLLERSKVVARGTYYNFDYDICKCYKDLLSIGFQEVNILPDILDVDSDVKMNQLLHQLDRFHAFVLDYAREKREFPFGPLIIQIRSLFFPKKKMAYECGLGKIIYSIDYKGDIYPCHRHSGDIAYLLGNVNNNDCKPFNNVPISYQCDKCWNRYTCSHGCRYEDVMAGGDGKNKYFCAYSKKMTEIAIALCGELDKEMLYNIMRCSDKILEGYR